MSRDVDLMVCPEAMLTHSASGQECTVLIPHLYSNNTMPTFLDLIWTKYHLEDLTAVYTAITRWHRTDCVRWDAKRWRGKTQTNIFGKTSATTHSNNTIQPVESTVWGNITHDLCGWRSRSHGADGWHMPIYGGAGLVTHSATQTVSFANSDRNRKPTLPRRNPSQRSGIASQRSQSA